LELKAGRTDIARRLAEEAYNTRYGVQAEAAQVLRTIDAEEHNQKVLVANRTAEDAVDAFKNRNFKMAQTILSSVDMRQLTPQMAGALRELAAAPEMQPAGNSSGLANNKEIIPAANKDQPGMARAS